MKLKGPYLTLVSGLAVAGVLLTLSANAVRKDEGGATVEAVASTTPEAAEPSDDAAKPDGDAAKPDDDAAKPDGDAAEPSDDAATPSGTYAGSIKGGGASVAIAIKDGDAIAYVCDGKKVEAWLQGPADSTALSLTGKAGASLTAKYDDGQLAGTIKTAGKKWAFKVKTVKAPSGLYRAARNVRSAKVVGGWIVYDGEQVGMLNSDGTETPAPPIDLTTRTVIIDGTTVQTAVVDGSPVD